MPVISSQNSMYASLDYVKRMAFAARPSDEAIQEDKIIAASRIFDSLCGVPAGYFKKADGTQEIREFRGDGTNYLRVTPYAENSIDDLRFRDAGLLPEFIEHRASWLLEFPDCFILNRCHIIEITAKWGYEFVPADIEAVVGELAISLWREKDPAYLRVIAESNAPLGGLSLNAISRRFQAVVDAHKRSVIIV